MALSQKGRAEALRYEGGYMACKMPTKDSRHFYEEMFDEEALQGFKDIGSDYRNTAAARADGIYLSNGKLFFFSNGKAYRAVEL